MALRRIDVHRAVERGDVAVLKRYLDAGGDTEKKDTEYGAAPLHWASLRGSVEALRLLLDHGADLESRTGTDGTPLVWGCMGGDAQVVRHLLERGADISAVTKGKGTALHHATHSGHPDVVAMLLEKGADPRAQDNRGERPGDKFDSEVAEGVKRAITQAVAKARDDKTSLRKSSSSRSKRSSDKSRGRAADPSRRLASLDDDKKNADGDDGPTPGANNDQGKHENDNGNEYDNDYDDHNNDDDDDEKSKKLRLRVSASRSESAVARSAAEAFLSGTLSGTLNEDDSLSAAAAAIAAAAWTPARHKEEKNAGLSSNRRSASRTGNGTINSGSVGDREGGTGAAPRENGDSPAAVAVTARLLPQHSSREVRPKRSVGGDGDAPLSRGGTAVTEAPRRELFSSPPPPPRDARVPSPATTSGLELDGLRRQVEELTAAVAAAESREAEGRDLMRQALAEVDERAEEARRAGRARLVKLNALVQALEQRLREKDKHVERFDAQLKDRTSRLRQEEQEATALRSHVSELNNGMIVLRKCLNRPSAEASSTATASPPHPPTEDQQASASKGHQRRRSSPALSPRVETALQETASLVDEGNGTGKVFFIGGGGGSHAEGRRSTMGTGGISTGVGNGAGEARGEGVQGRRRDDWQERTPRKSKKQPVPAVVEDHERLGSLYSMIARR